MSGAWNGPRSLFLVMNSPAVELLSSASARALELPSLLALLAELAATDLGRERLLRLSPHLDRAALDEARRRFDETHALVAERRLVGSFDQPLGGLLEQLGSGRAGLVGQALVQLNDLLAATAEIRNRLLDPAHVDSAGRERFASLSGLARQLPDLAALSRQIQKCLDRRGEVREDASPKLSSLRERIRRVRDGLYGELKRHLEVDREHLSEETIPMRGGRLVLVLASGARGKVPGLVHGRSATGKSFYFEPLSVVESNNNLQQAVEDEEAERQRILAELLAAARRALPELQSHASFLGEIDALQAMVRWAQLCGGQLAEMAGADELVIRGGRHPLLDGSFAELRERSLGQGGHRGRVVPLDLELSKERRTLIVTGPNAGGKTVVLKTVGVLALLHQCGLPVPAGPGTRLPLLSRLVATVGDEQDLLADRSTFSGRLVRLKEAWEMAGEGALVLLDELGSGTDPEEGTALASALVEGLLAKGCWTLITTHLVGVATAALELPGAGCAAMEFDPQTGAPTYHLIPGPPGGSEAIALARRLHLPAEWLDRAEARLTGEHRDLRRLLTELERTRVELAAERDRLERERSGHELARARLARESAALEAERTTLSRRLKSELEAFRSETRKKLRDEVAKLRTELEGGRRKGLEASAEARLFAQAPTLPEPEVVDELPPTLGGRVRHRAFGWEGTLEKLQDTKAEVVVRGKHLRCALEELVGVSAGTPEKQRPTVELRRPVSDALVEPPRELHLIGKRVEPALEEIDAYLDQALLAGEAEVRLVHGHGTGRLRDAVREHLRRHPAVVSSRPGGDNEGGNGATVVVLRAR